MRPRGAGPWIAGAAVIITLGAIGLLIARPAAPAPAPAPITGNPSQAAIARATQPPLATVAPAATQRRALTPTLTPTDTATFAPPSPAASTSLPDASATGAPAATIIAEDGSGPGVSKSFDLPEGLYRVTFHAEKGFELLLPVVEQGDCGSEPLFDGADGPFDGSAMYDSPGCRVHFEVDGAGGGWSIGVDSVSAQAAASIPLTLSGNAPKTSNVVWLPEGQYTVAVESKSQTLVVTPRVVDGECLERPILVATAPGSYQTVYDSRGCRVIFEISYAGGLWTLSVTVK